MKLLSEIPELQTHWTTYWHEATPEVSSDGFLRLVEENHLRNFFLWHEEDTARRDDLGSKAVHRAKRAIDRCNQERNDFVERMDAALIIELPPPFRPLPAI